jgi:hypothetical protein
MDQVLVAVYHIAQFVAEAGEALPAAGAAAGQVRRCSLHHSRPLHTMHTSCNIFNSRFPPPMPCPVCRGPAKAGRSRHLCT